MPQDPHDPAHIAGYEKQFRRTGNPIYAWASWKIARHNGLPLPVWVAEYLDRCAGAVDDISRKRVRGRTVKSLLRKEPPIRKLDVPALLTKGFGFSKGRGHTTAFAAWEEHNSRVMVGVTVAARMGVHRESLGAAAAEVAHRLDISESTAQRAYQWLGPIGRDIKDEAALSAGQR